MADTYTYETATDAGGHPAVRLYKNGRTYHGAYPCAIRLNEQGGATLCLTTPFGLVREPLRAHVHEGSEGD